MDTKEVLKAVEKLATKLGTTAEKLMSYYIKEAKLFKLYFFIRIAVAVFIFGVGIAPLFYLAPKIDWEWVEPLGLGIAFIVSAIVALIGLVMLVVAIANVEDLVRSVKNPEYVAIEDLFASIID